MATELEIKRIIGSAVLNAYQKTNAPMGQDVFVGQHPIDNDITEAVFKALFQNGCLRLS